MWSQCEEGPRYELRGKGGVKLKDGDDSSFAIIINKFDNPISPT